METNDKTVTFREGDVMEMCGVPCKINQVRRNKVVVEIDPRYSVANGSMVLNLNDVNNSRSLLEGARQLRKTIWEIRDILDSDEKDKLGLIMEHVSLVKKPEEENGKE